MQKTQKSLKSVQLFFSVKITFLKKYNKMNSPHWTQRTKGIITYRMGEHFVK